MKHTLEEYRNYFKNLHDVEVNQKYNKTLPYSFHLEMVVKQAHKFSDLIPTNADTNDERWNQIIVACWAHDSIEDCRKTYNDIWNMCGKDIADIVYCCTEEKGKDRKERHSEKYFKELAQNKDAVFVKLCDIIANVKFSLLTNSSMFSKYKHEYPTVKTYLYKQEYKKMFDYLDELFKIN